MSQVNLLPPEIRQREQVRRRFFLVVAAAGGVAVLVILYYFTLTLSLAGVNDDLRAQQATNQGIQTKIDGLRQYAQLQTEVQAREALTKQVYVNEVSWSSLLMDLSRTVPSDAYLQSVTGAVAQPGTETGAAASLVGNIGLSGTALGTDSVTLWLTRLDQVPGFANASTSNVSEQDELSGIYDFTDTVDLTTDAVTKRGGAAT